MIDNSELTAWERKAHRAIHSLAQDAYKQANPVEVRRKRAYSLPRLAHRLVEVLGWHDRREAEREIKALLLNYASGLHADSDLIA